MKRFFSMFLVLLLLLPISSGIADMVSQMEYVITMPDVTREGLYTGEVENGVPHGYGVFVAVNSEGIAWHYLGEWTYGAMTGQGGQYWDNGQAQVGTYAGNSMICGEIHLEASKNGWMDLRPDEQGRVHVKDLRPDGSVVFDGYVDARTGEYKEGTIYTADGSVFFSGTIGEGFDWSHLK